MTRILLVLYNLIVLPFSFLMVMIASCFNAKIRRGIKGRWGLFRRIKKDIAPQAPNRHTIWIHVSSYGEFLQARPVLEQLKKINPDLFIIVTVFSPSGVDNITIQPPVDYLCYLPFDTYFRMKKFVSLISPSAAVIVRHDIWPNFVWRMKREGIPLFLIDATLPENSSRFYPVLKSISKLLFSMIPFVVTISEEDAQRFKPLVKSQDSIIVMGDTKYDQVFERAKNTEKIAPLLKNAYLKTKKILVAGSTWPADEEELIPAFIKLHKKNKDTLLIIAPHEPTAKRLAEIENRCREYGLTSVKLSELDDRKTGFHCLIIDRIGLLANIYSLGQAAFVGGSFHYKIHNVLEPAVFGIPVLFGPKMTNSAEAYNLLKHEAAVIVESKEQLSDVLIRLFEDAAFANELGSRAKELVMQNVGSSQKIARLLLKQG